MAIRWNVFQGKESGRSKVHRAERPLTDEAIKNIVSKEVSAASMKSQLMKYYDEASASSIRTEAVLGEIKEAMDDSLAIIKEAAISDSNNSDKLDELNRLVQRNTQLSENLESSVHKDNLLTYKNIKDILESIENNNRARAGRLRTGIIVCLIINGITILGVAAVILLQLGII